MSGTGLHYAVTRQVLEEGALFTPLDSVALFETNVTHTSPSVAALSIIKGITAGVAIYCLSSPKSCFGSCPTFYVTDGTQDVLQAEGFSASVAPSLEARDVDALFRARPHGRDVRAHMMNEAHETPLFATQTCLPSLAWKAVGFWPMTVERSRLDGPGGPRNDRSDVRQAARSTRDRPGV